MLKRITALALCLILMMGLLPAADAFGREPIAPESRDRCCQTLRVNVNAPDYVRPDYDGKLIAITPQRVQDTFDYLNAHYVEKYPEQALACYTGTGEDRANLLKLLKPSPPAAPPIRRRPMPSTAGSPAISIMTKIPLPMPATPSTAGRATACPTQI